ncbi:MAG: O-antigen ligase family protein [Chloroflexota bacterium]|nr:O-antigen ligase family protein [Chloroflexota bacterium]
MLADVPFLLAVAGAVIIALTKRSRRVYPGIRSTALFLIVCTLHILFVIFGQVSGADYLRGLVPFVFVAFGWVTTKVVKEGDIPQLMTAMVVIGLVFAIQGLLELPQWLAGEIWRTTLNNPNQGIPFPLVAFHICASRVCLGTRSTRSKTWYAVACGITLLSILCTGTRSLLVGAIVPLPMMIVFTKHRTRLAVRLVSAIVITVAVVLITIPTVTLDRAFRIDRKNDTLRFTSGDTGISTRTEENDVAIAYFLSSPVVGTGLGYQFDTTGMYYQVERVGYVHNSFLYLLMDFGVLGILYFVPAAIVIKGLLKRFKRGPNLDEAAAAALVNSICALIMFAIGFVMVRVIQFNVLLFSIIALGDVLAGTRRGMYGSRIVDMPRTRARFMLHAPAITERILAKSKSRTTLRRAT